MSMRMNDYAGKEFLATVRAEDFAHAGEEEAIDLVFKDVSTKSDRKILDAGCGRGGTADYVRRHGWGEVVGIDIEAQSIERAKEKYPACQFHVCDMCVVGDHFGGKFELIYMLNAFYAVPDKQKAIQSLRASAKADALLCLFDYVTYDASAPPLEGILAEKPSTPGEFDILLRAAKWQVESNTNLDQKYVQWYRNFLDRFDGVAVKSTYPKDVIELVREKYKTLLTALEDGTLGGLLIFARAL
jgi:SAM-dependent methyltransferase